MSTTYWIQAISGVFTFLLALVTFCISIRVKTLSDVVGEMSKQTTALKRLMHIAQFDLLEKIKPSFIEKSSRNSDPSKFWLKLVNSEAVVLNIRTYNHDIHFKSSQFDKFLSVNDEFVFEVTQNFGPEVVKKNTQFDFIIEMEGKTKDKFIQKGTLICERDFDPNNNKQRMYGISWKLILHYSVFEAIERDSGDGKN